MKRLSALVCVLVALIGAVWVVPAAMGRAGVDPEYPKPPEEGIYVSDRAVVLSIGDLQKINKAAADIKTSTGVPVMVVTIRSLEDMGGVTVETYAQGLFNSWEIGSAKDNRGILLLYSWGDRKARIQLGAGWPKSQDTVTQGIMDGVMIPAFKRNANGQAILGGVVALGAMIEKDNVERKSVAGGGGAGGGGGGGVAGGAAGGTPTAVPPPPTTIYSGLPVGTIVLGVAGVLVVVGVVVVVLRVVSRRAGGGGDGGAGGGGGTDWGNGG